MKVNDEIKEAIEKAIAECDSQRCFAQKSGCCQASISKYLTGDNKVIREENWRKIYPLIKNFLPERYQAADLIAKIAEQHVLVTGDMTIQKKAECEIARIVDGGEDAHRQRVEEERKKYLIERVVEKLRDFQIDELEVINLQLLNELQKKGLRKRMFLKSDQEN